MKKIKMYQVDAFTDNPFSGNPAAVCILDDNISEETMLDIAAEMNLSETAFVRKLDDKNIKKSNRFSLRWFTPEVEVDLCGHATLATSWVLFKELGLGTDDVTYETRSGDLIAGMDDGYVVLNFPSNGPKEVDISSDFLDAVGVGEVLGTFYSKNSRKLLVHLPDEEDVHSVKPDFEKMKNLGTGLDIRGVIVTSEGEDYDFISRYFGPWVGVNEDPVTGSAHTVLGPYWSKALDKEVMTAYQASKRGGELIVEVRDDGRVELKGKAVVVMDGYLFI